MGKKNKRTIPEDSTHADNGDGHGTGEGADQTGRVTATPCKQHKKHKKSKKEEQDIEEDSAEHSLCVDDQEMDKTKKKKKKRKADSEDKIEEDHRSSKVKKQKFKSEIDTGKCSKLESTRVCSVAGLEETSSENRSREKKKKKLLCNGEDDASVIMSRENTPNGLQAEESPTDMNTVGDDTTESREVKKKRKKDKKKSKDVEDATSETDAVLKSESQDTLTDGSSKEKKKSKKQKNKDSEENLNISAVTVEDTSVHKKKKKRKHQEDKSEQEIDRSKNGLANGLQENGAHDTESTTEKKRGKTKKSKASRSDENEAGEYKDTAEETKKKKKDKKKKKKDKSEESVNLVECTIPNGQDSPAAIKSNEKSKKKKKTENLEEERSNTEATDDNSKDQIVKQRKKERKSKDKDKPEQDDTNDGRDVCHEPVDLRHHQTNLTGLGKPNTNTEPVQTDSAQTPTMGQWSTNMFKNSERQNKFIRLLGGFKKAGNISSTPAGEKKGLVGSLQLKQESGSGGQRALTHVAAQEMNRRLESDYERALSFSARGQRGIGLGFTPDPAEGKKFHIDVNRVASKTFD